MARGKPYRFARFGRGLNTTDGAYSLREGYDDDPQGLGSEARRLLNVVSKHRGNVRRRAGCVSIGSLASNGKDISVIGQDAAGFAVISTTGGGLYAADGAVPSVVTQLVAEGGLSLTAPWTFLRLPGAAYGPAYGMNGVDTPRETDGTGAGTGTWTHTAGTGVPNGTHMTYHDNRVMVVGVAATPYRLFSSAPGLPRDWNTAGLSWALDIAPDDGSPLVAAASVGSYTIVFKERGIWVVYDSETGANRKIADNVGTLAARSVVSTELGCFFLDPERGVMLTDGAETRRVSEQIQATLDELTVTALASATGAYHNGHYYLSVEDVSGLRTTYDYDTEQNSWWVHSVDASALAVWDRGAGPLLVGVVDAAIWHLFKDGETQDNLAAFESYWSGPFHTFGESDVKKRCREIHLDGRGTVNIYVAKDYEYGQGTLEDSAAFTGADDTFGGGGLFGGAGVFGSSVEIGEDSIFSLGVARAWSLTVYSSAAQSWELDSYTMRMSRRED